MMESLFHHISRFFALNSAATEVGMEQRRSHRLYTNLDIEYRLKCRNLPGYVASQAIMKNICQGGAYLECPTQPWLTAGQVGHFTFKSLSPFRDRLKIIELSARAVVLRIDCSPEGSTWGVAVQFLSGPLISYS